MKQFQNRLIFHKTYIRRNEVEPELYVFKDAVRTAEQTHPVSLIIRIHPSDVTLFFAVRFAAALH
jgi:hypothetical protein